MLETCFSSPTNVRPLKPRAKIVDCEQGCGGFENQAFTALWRNKRQLGIAQLYRCRAARMDGYFIMEDGEVILLEMKEALSWGATQAAGFQFLAGRQLLKLDAKRGIIVFQRFAGQWERAKPHGAWGQLSLEAEAVAAHIVIGALQVREDLSVHSHSATLEGSYSSEASQRAA